MPFPLFLVAIAIGAALLGGGAAVALNWDSVVLWWKGKKLAILGERATGKTHLSQFLREGEIPTSYSATLGTAKATGARRRLRDLSLDLKEGADVSGSMDSYGDWHALTSTADVVVYLVRADRILAFDPTTQDRVRADMQHLGRWLDERGGSRPRFYIVGTHCDLDPNFGRLDAAGVPAYRDGFRKHPVIQEAVVRAGGAKVARVHLGSMCDKGGTEALAYAIFSEATL